MVPPPASIYKHRARRPLTERLDLEPDALPGGGNWYPEEDTLILLLDLVEQRGCREVLCLGGGVAVAVLARALALRGAGRVTAVESDQRALSLTCEMLAGIGAEAHLVHAELTEYDKHNLWYARWALSDVPRDVDLLFIDGPGHFAGRSPRWPAGPELFDHLAANGVVVLDDGKRVKEKKALKLWSQAYPWLIDQKAKRTGGAVVLSREGGS